MTTFLRNTRGSGRPGTDVLTLEHTFIKLMFSVFPVRKGTRVTNLAGGQEATHVKTTPLLTCATGLAGQHTTLNLFPARAPRRTLRPLMTV